MPGPFRISRFTDSPEKRPRLEYSREHSRCILVATGKREMRARQRAFILRTNHSAFHGAQLRASVSTELRSEGTSLAEGRLLSLSVAASDALFVAAALVQRRSMFIQTQPTPNPASLMFIPGRTVMEVRANREEACVTIQDKVLGAWYRSHHVARASRDCLPFDACWSC